MAREMTREELLRVDGVKPRDALSYVRGTFGTFPYTDRSDGSIDIGGDWVEQQIVLAELPQLGSIARPVATVVSCHRLIKRQLEACWAMIERLGLLHHVITWDGLWVPRHMSWSVHRGLSSHSWGIAFDINARWNGYGQEPAAAGQRGSVRELLGVMEAHGFGWGGWWSPAYRDGMHFQVFRCLTDDEIPVLRDDGAEAAELARRRTYYEQELHQPLSALYGGVGTLFRGDERARDEALAALNRFNGVLEREQVKG